MPQFVHLHLHTDYSMLDGACDVDKLCERAKQLGMPAVAMTDHGNIFGAVHFVNAAYKAGIKPNDQIIKIDNNFTKDMTLTDAVKAMRGPRPGTSPR
jgi:DNA polymerase III alpha subunit